MPLDGSVSASGALQGLYADDTLLVFDKPAGLLSVPGRGPDKQDCLASRVQAVYADALVVHRLDMATSGLLLMARGASAQRALSAAFAERAVTKRYMAVVDGTPPASEQTDGGWQTIDLPIAVDWPRRPLRVVAASGQPSTTRWRALPGTDARWPHCTRLELGPRHWPHPPAAAAPGRHRPPHPGRCALRQPHAAGACPAAAAACQRTGADPPCLGAGTALQLPGPLLKRGIGDNSVLAGAPETLEHSIQTGVSHES